MSLNIPSSLQRTIILASALQAFQNTLAPLRAFSTAYSQDLTGVKEFDVPYWPLQGEANKTFVPADGYTFSHSLNQYVVPFDTRDTADGGDFVRVYQELKWTSAEWERYQWDPAAYGRLKGYELAKGIMSTILGKVIATSFDLVDEGAAAAFTFNKLLTSINVKAGTANWPSEMRSLILNQEFFANLMADSAVSAAYASGTNQVFTQGAVSNIAGWDLFPPQNTIPNNTAGNGGGTKKLSGLAVHPSAMAVAVAPVIPTAEVRAQLSAFEIITSSEVPDLAFAHRKWGNAQMDTSYEVLECRFAAKAIIPKDVNGDAVGTNPGLIRLVRPS